MQEPAFTIHRGSKQRGMGLPMHSHDEAQLIYAAAGMVQIHTPEGRWLVPSQLAVWIPAGTSHRLEVLSDAQLWMVQWQPAMVGEWAPPITVDRPFALRVTPLLRSLLTAAMVDDIGAAKAELIVRLMLHELTETTHAPTFLPLPASAVGLRMADVVLGDQQQLLGLHELTARAATSVRTVSRLFPKETGLTFKAWRQRARIVQAMDRLARGTPIARVATQLGFSSTAAFSSAFRQVTATTPTQFLGQAE